MKYEKVILRMFVVALLTVSARAWPMQQAAKDVTFGAGGGVVAVLGWKAVAWALSKNEDPGDWTQVTQNKNNVATNLLAITATQQKITEFDGRIDVLEGKNSSVFKDDEDGEEDSNLKQQLLALQAKMNGYNFDRYNFEDIATNVQGLKDLKETFEQQVDDLKGKIEGFDFEDAKLQGQKIVDLSKLVGLDNDNGFMQQLSALQEKVEGYHLGDIALNVQGLKELKETFEQRVDENDKALKVVQLSTQETLEKAREVDSLKQRLGDLEGTLAGLRIVLSQVMTGEGKEMDEFEAEMKEELKATEQREE